MPPDFTAPSPCDSISEQTAAAQCPTMDLRGRPVMPEQVLDFVLRFAAFFFERVAADIHAGTDISEELVWYWASEGGINLASAESADPLDLAMVSFVFYSALGQAIGLDLFDHDIDPEHVTLGDLADAIVGVVPPGQAGGAPSA